MYFPRRWLHNALGTHHMCCHLVLLGLAQYKPGLTNWACSRIWVHSACAAILALLWLVQSKPSRSAQAWTRQAQAELDDSTCVVYPAPQTPMDDGNVTQWASFSLTTASSLFFSSCFRPNSDCEFSHALHTQNQLRVEYSKFVLYSNDHILRQSDIETNSLFRQF